jgi:hypothetical protein
VPCRRGGSAAKGRFDAIAQVSNYKVVAGLLGACALAACSSGESAQPVDIKKVFTVESAYAERVSRYTPADDTLAGTANNASSALGAICTAIADGSAAERGPLVPAPAPPSQVAPVGNINKPQRLLTTPNPVCAD